MMKIFKLLLTLTIILSLMSCIERKKSKNGDVAEKDLIQSLDGPRVIRDTIIQVVILDTVQANRDVAQVVEPQKVNKTVATTRSSGYTGQDSKNSGSGEFDGSNSGFFDNYRTGYHGDPNSGIENQPAKPAPVSNNQAADLDRQKEAIAKQLDALEKKNKKALDRQENWDEERLEYNKKVKEELQKGQQQTKKTQKESTNKGKTLDSNIFMDY